MYTMVYSKKSFLNGLKRIENEREFSCADSLDAFFGSLEQMIILYAYVLEYNNEDDCVDPGVYIDYEDYDGISDVPAFISSVQEVMQYLDDNNHYFKPSGWQHRLGWNLPSLKRVVGGVDTLTGLQVQK